MDKKHLHRRLTNTQQDIIDLSTEALINRLIRDMIGKTLQYKELIK